MIVGAAAAASAPAAVTTTTTATTTPASRDHDDPPPRPSPDDHAAAPRADDAAPTTVAPTTTIPDRLAGVNWIQATYASPCTDSTVQLVGGSAIQGANRAVLDDVVAIDSAAGLALAFLSCRGRVERRPRPRPASSGHGPVSSRRWPSMISARRPGSSPSMHQTSRSSRRPPLPRRGVLRRCRQPPDAHGDADGFTVTSTEQVAAFEQTVTAIPAVGDDAELVRRSVTPAALCFRWDNVWLSAGEEPAEPVALTEPSAELQTIRLALIHVTGRWIDPTDRMNAEMAAVVTAYQEARGLAVDGSIGRPDDQRPGGRPRVPRWR